ncbi:response regulator [Chlorobium phaeovibrioides]|uniref:histidine kinase n=2 Tax=Chlorobium phaeovibrioides TaxID=1094 RepID=A0A432AXI7_CHLPH|nr:response regulator [Chlorobium phaeovibrioides]
MNMESMTEGKKETFSPEDSCTGGGSVFAVQSEILRRFKDVYELFPGSFSIMNAGGKLIAWNRYMRDVIIGRPEGEMSDVDGMRAIHPDDRDFVMQQFSAVISSGADKTGEARVLVGGGPEYTWRAITGRKIEVDGEPCVLAIGIDITERQRLESLQALHLRMLELAEASSIEELVRIALDEAEQMTGSAIGFCTFITEELNNEPVQVWSTNASNHFRHAGMGEAGHPILRLSHLWDDVIKTKQLVIHNDYPSLRKRSGLPVGHDMVIRALVIPLMKSGEVTAIFGICNKAAAYTEADAGTASRIADCLWGIVTRKLAEQSEQRMQEQLQQSQKIELLGQLAGGIAHDFNNMLSVTLGYTEILLESIPETHPFFEGLEAIRRSTERSANLTSQLLSFARKQLRQMQVINVNEEVAVMLPILKSALGESIQCNCKPAIDAVRVWMDPTQFDQILTNLCLNARDAIGHSGTITIATGVKHVETSDIRSGFPCLLPGIYVSISVTDTGTGIKAHDLPHIFEPFYTTKEVGEGSGLGLSTVYGIARQNNGCVECWTEAGSGSSFTVYLPRYAKQESTTVDTTPELHGKTTGSTILVVEDVPDILQLVTRFLENQGHRVLTAEDAETALAMVRDRQLPLKLLVSDVVLPGMNGVDMNQELRKEIPDLKTLFMSGYAPERIRQHGAFEEGVNFIQKPFAMKAFLKLIHDILEN